KRKAIVDQTSSNKRARRDVPIDDQIESTNCDSTTTCKKCTTGVTNDFLSVPNYQYQNNTNGQQNNNKARKSYWKSYCNAISIVINIVFVVLIVGYFLGIHFYLTPLEKELNNQKFEKNEFQREIENQNFKTQLTVCNDKNEFQKEIENQNFKTQLTVCNDKIEFQKEGKR
ncbi:hypothetical protein BpHYR1_012216, partial [Brachionus plicatilis]